jgi:hypothetical protein
MSDRAALRTFLPSDARDDELLANQRLAQARSKSLPTVVPSCGSPDHAVVRQRPCGRVDRH